jgi:hypothetical protein
MNNEDRRAVHERIHKHAEAEGFKTNLNSAIIDSSMSFQTLASLMYNIQKLSNECDDKTIYLCNNLRLVKTNGIYILHKIEGDKK